MVARRLFLFAAFLFGMLAVAASLAPREQSGVTTSPVQGSRLGTTTPQPQTKTVAAELSVAAEAKSTLVTAQKNSLIVVTITGDGGYDLVSLEDFGIVKPLDPKIPTKFQFLADHTGTFSVILVKTSREIGRIQVTP